MNSAVAAMLRKYDRQSADDHVNALREIVQELALCGLWRAKFFERAAFYGGTSLRIFHGLDRFSEDMDFSLLTPNPNFNLTPYCTAMEKELRAWGFVTTVEERERAAQSAIESAFLKADTKQLFLFVEAGDQVTGTLPRGQQLRIRVEVDTVPPPGFVTEARFLLLPIPFSVRLYTLPSLFAGKMHAVLCRAWGSRVKGRDWYDLVWYVSRQTSVDLAHLEERMRQSGHFTGEPPLNEQNFRRLLSDRIDRLDVASARADVERFVGPGSALQVWSRDFFHAVANGIRVQTRDESGAG